MMKSQPSAAANTEKTMTPIDHEVRTATERLVAAEKALVDANEAYAVAQRQVDQAKREIANVFLQLYVKLPTDARNKVRHAINNYGGNELDRDRLNRAKEREVACVVQEVEAARLQRQETEEAVRLASEACSEGEDFT